MRFIPECFYERSVLSVIDDLIIDGYACFDDLLLIDKHLLISNCLTVLNDEWYSFLLDTDIVALFKKALVSGKPDHATEVVRIMKEEAESYFTQPLTDLFDERLNDYQSAIKMGYAA